MNVTTSDRDFAVAKEIAGGLKKAKLCSLSRRKKADIDKVAAAGCYGIALEGPGNPWLSAQILKSDFNQALKDTQECIAIRFGPSR